MFDCIVIGSGFAGSVLARKFADDNKKVLVIDKRPHIGGNMYEDFSNNGVRIHKYGPHIFHTNNLEVLNYLKKFSDFYFYEHKVLAKIDGQYVPIPFNLKSLETLLPCNEVSLIKVGLAKYFPNQEKVSVFDLINNENETISKFGKFVFDKVFLNYTAKQWEIAASEVDTSVINRVPVMLNYDDRYFSDKYQCMPTEGFTKLFEKMLNHKNITLLLNTEANSKLELKDDGIYFENKKTDAKIIFTGAIDEFCNYKFGILPYRSIKLGFEDMELATFQSSSVVNYPNEEKFTRITEFKHLTNQKSDKTTILKEYPRKYNPKATEGNVPYYVIVNKENLAMHTKYVDYLSKYKNLYLVGRLAEYKYYNMDACIEKALSVYEFIK